MLVLCSFCGLREQPEKYGQWSMWCDGWCFAYVVASSLPIHLGIPPCRPGFRSRHLIDLFSLWSPLLILNYTWFTVWSLYVSHGSCFIFPLLLELEILSVICYLSSLFIQIRQCFQPSIVSYSFPLSFFLCNCQSHSKLHCFCCFVFFFLLVGWILFQVSGLIDSNNRKKQEMSDEMLH